MARVRPTFRDIRIRPMQIVADHLYFYQKFFLSAWSNMSPMQYGYLLVTIAVVGWLCMKSAPR